MAVKNQGIGSVIFNYLSVISKRVSTADGLGILDTKSREEQEEQSLLQEQKDGEVFMPYERKKLEIASRLNGRGNNSQNFLSLHALQFPNRLISL